MSCMRRGRPMPTTIKGGRRREFTGSVVLLAGYAGDGIVSSGGGSGQKGKMEAKQ